MNCAYCTKSLDYASGWRVLPQSVYQAFVAGSTQLLEPSATVTEMLEYVCDEACANGLRERQQTEALARAIVARWELSEFALAQLIHLIREHREGWTRR